MICKNCGHENQDGAKVCESCGQSLEADNNIKKEKIKISKEDSRKRTERQRKRSKDRDLMTYGMIIGSVMAFAVIFIVLSYFFKFGAEKEMARKNQVESGIQQDTELYEKAIKTSEEKIKAKDYKKAIEILKAIPEEAGDYYKQGQEKLTEIENLIIEDIKEAMKEDDKEAEKLVKTYEALLPESKALTELKEKITGQKEELADKEEEKAKENSDEKEDESKAKEESESEKDKLDAKDARANRRALSEEYDLEMLRRTNSYGQNGNPAYTDVYKESDFLNKSLKIDAHMGEVRTEPNLNSGVAGYVNDGDMVKCEEVFNDGGRYWLKIENGWISSKLITGEFRD